MFGAGPRGAAFGRPLTVTLVDWPELRRQHWLRSLLGSQATERYWVRAFDGAYDRSIDAWSATLLYSKLDQRPNDGGAEWQFDLCNIGFGPDAVHTKRTSRYDRMHTSELDFPLVHPHFEMVDEEADRYVAERMYSRYPLPRPHLEQSKCRIRGPRAATTRDMGRGRVSFNARHLTARPG